MVIPRGGSNLKEQGKSYSNFALLVIQRGGTVGDPP